jgi:hypothetical protein
MSTVIRAICVAGVMLTAAFPLGAQTRSGQFQYQVTPYFWMTDFDGDVGARGRTASVNESFGDIWDNMDFGAMGAFEARWDRWVFLGDTIYLNFENNVATPGLAGFTGANVKSRMLIVDPEFGYQIVRRDGLEVNALFGGRYWRLKNEVRLINGGVAEFTETRNWIDPIIGFQVRRDINPSFYISAKGDIGGFSAAARLDWQAFSAVGYRFNDRISGIVGYRHLSVDYSKDGFLFDTTLSGIVAGVGIGF